MVLIIKSRYEKLIKFAKDNTKVKQLDFWGKRRVFKCPCCDFQSINGISDETDRSILIGFRGYLVHLNAQIRLHASESHIKIMEKLFNREITSEFIRTAIMKNKLVTEELERIYLRNYALEIKEVEK